MATTRRMIALLAAVAIAATGCKPGEKAKGEGTGSVAVVQDRIAAGGVQPAANALGAARPTDLNPEAGANLFSAMNCDGCHGGGAVGWVGPSLVDGRWRYGGTDEELFTSIFYGRPKGNAGVRRGHRHRWSMDAGGLPQGAGGSRRGSDHVVAGRGKRHRHTDGATATRVKRRLRLPPLPPSRQPRRQYRRSRCRRSTAAPRATPPTARWSGPRSRRSPPSTAARTWRLRWRRRSRTAGPGSGVRFRCLRIRRYRTKTYTRWSNGSSRSSSLPDDHGHASSYSTRRVANAHDDDRGAGAECAARRGLPPEREADGRDRHDRRRDGWGRPGRRVARAAAVQQPRGPTWPASGARSCSSPPARSPRSRTWSSCTCSTRAAP